MILEIRLSNFFSIKEKIVLDLRAGNINNKNAKSLTENVFEYNKQKVLKTALLYGSNASGKSNIIKAIRFCSEMILNSHNHNENTTFNYQKFKFENHNEKPSEYFIRFVMDEIEYEYGFSLMHNNILTEHLHHYPNGRRAKIFTRDETLGNDKKEKYSFASGTCKRPFDVAENTSDKTLFISRASQFDRVLAKKIYYYFDRTFILDYVNLNYKNIKIALTNYKEKILQALKIADSDIVNIEIEGIQVPHKEVSINEKEKTVDVKEGIQEHLKIKTYHQTNPKVEFDLNEESDGTKKIFGILLTLIDILENNKILLVDEIELHFHPKIVDYIFNLFKASSKAQLICSTHNTRFLDLKKFRKDQIYFVNKKQDASTDVYSLYDYKDFRETMDLEKAYLDGRFDAVPLVNDDLETLKNEIIDKNGQ